MISSTVYFREIILVKQSQSPVSIYTPFFPGVDISIIKIRPSYIYNGNSYTGKTTSLYWDGPQIPAQYDWTGTLKTDIVYLRSGYEY